MYSEIQPQMHNRRVDIRLLEEGMETFVLGLSAKTLLANPMGGLWNNLSVIGYDSISTPYAWLGAFAYSFQIYFDFSGYSMMAIGVGKMLGFELPQNFNLPYMSGSAGEFWRRWHITLGRWFKNYIYFPLGGSRVGKWKTMRNMLAVWAFTGLWHGASWNFVLWGLIFFVLLTLEKNVYGKFLERTHILKHAYIIFIIPSPGWSLPSRICTSSAHTLPVCSRSSLRMRYSPTPGMQCRHSTTIGRSWFPVFCSARRCL